MSLCVGAVSFPGVQKPIDSYGPATGSGAGDAAAAADDDDDDDDDDDFDLFGEDDEEEKAKADKLREERSVSHIAVVS